MVGRQNPQGNIGAGPGSGKVLARILLIARRAFWARPQWKRSVSLALQSCGIIYTVFPRRCTVQTQIQPNSSPIPRAVREGEELSAAMYAGELPRERLARLGPQALKD